LKALPRKDKRLVEIPWNRDLPFVHMVGDVYYKPFRGSFFAVCSVVCGIICRRF
jgi:hypothetical protein